jgi:cobalt/nickel transport system permease protein
VVILGMTYRYLFLLLRTAHEMLESRKSRLVGSLEGPERRRLAAASVGVLLSKSFQLTAEVHSAMRARGFQGEAYILDEPAIHRRDWVQLSVFIALASAVLLLGR